METPAVPLIFDLFQRTIKPRLDAFDKCSVLEIENSALLPAFVFRDIKDIKRERVRRIHTMRIAFVYDHDRAAVADFCERTIESSAESASSAQRAEKSREQTEGLRPQARRASVFAGGKAGSRRGRLIESILGKSKNPAHFLAFCRQEIKEIKRGARRSSRPDCWRR